MTKIPNVEERVAEMPTNKCPVCDGDGCTVEHDLNDPAGQTPIQVQCDFCHAEGKITTLDCVTHTLTADRLALLTELRESGLLEERDLEEIEKECIAKGVQSGKQKRAISIAFGSNAKARAVKEFISNMDKK